MKSPSRPRAPAAHEIDCQIVRNFLEARASKTESIVLEAFVRIERRATRTSVSGKDHVLHVQEPRTAQRVYCGRYTARVNSVTLREANKDLESEQWCLRCVARIKKEQALHVR